VALLRGVNNIGQAKRVAMAELRLVFESLGFRDVQTLLNSGNVIFSATVLRRDELKSRIEQGLAARLGLNSPVILLSAREVVSAVRDNPFSDIAKNPSHLLVMVPRKRSDQQRLRPLLNQRWAPEAFAIGSRVAYVWCARGVPRSPLWAAVDRALEQTGTVRNLATFTKASALVARPPSRTVLAVRQNS
jgi:uncharacterized protein (DUF1697 family)